MSHKLEEWIAPGSFFNGTHYRVRGQGNQGEKVVFVHGIGSFHDGFDEMAATFASKGHFTVQYDLIGRGFASPSPNGKYGDAEHVEQLLQLVEHLGLDSFHLVGHSMGGALVALFARKYSDCVKSLTLVCPAGLMDSLGLSLLRKRCLQGVLRAVLADESRQDKIWRDAFYRHTETTREQEEIFVHNMNLMVKNNPEVKNALFRSVLEFPLYGLQREVETLGALNIPVLLLWGRKDTVVPYNNYKRWRAALAKGGCKRLEIKKYSDVAHGLIMEICEQINRDVLEFVESTVSSHAEDAPPQSS